MIQLDIEPGTRARRRSVAPRRLEDFAVLSSAGQRNLTSDSDATLKGIMFEIIDNCVAELQTRFNEKNKTYVKSMMSLWPPGNDFLAFESVLLLANLMQFPQNEKHTLQNECLIAKPFLLDKFNEETRKSLGDICAFM